MSDLTGGNTPGLLEGLGSVLAALAAVWVAFSGSRKRGKRHVADDLGEQVRDAIDAAHVQGLEQALAVHDETNRQQADYILQLQSFIRAHNLRPPRRREP